MNKKVFNVPRVAAEDFGNDHADLPNKLVWVSISEPNKENTITTNKYLDKCANLKLAFWDLHEPIGDVLLPPSKEDAATIVDFLMEHYDKSVFVNCAAGVSRSGAIAQFCADFLGHEWGSFYRNVAIPNKVLYRLMVEYYQEKYLTKTDG
jgi:protein-tyrosine phosphatase